VWLTLLQNPWEKWRTLYQIWYFACETRDVGKRNELQTIIKICVLRRTTRLHTLFTEKAFGEEKFHWGGDTSSLLSSMARRCQPSTTFHSATTLQRHLKSRVNWPIESVARRKLKTETVFQRDRSAAISMHLKWKDFHLVKSRPLPLNYSCELSLHMSSIGRHVDRCFISLSLQFQQSESMGQVTALIQFCLAMSLRDKRQSWSSFVWLAVQRA